MHVVAQLIGYPRIGPNRELKWALERMWSGRLAADAIAERVDELRRAHLDEQRGAVGSAVDDFFLYDEVLETALMLGVRPANLGGTSFDLLTALARGTPEPDAVARAAPGWLHHLADPWAVQLRPAQQARRPRRDRPRARRWGGDRCVDALAAEWVPPPAR